MNKEMFLKVADAIENERDGVSFKMSTWISQTCGTQACIAGHVAILADPARFRHKAVWVGDEGQMSLRMVAIKALGITEQESADLFSGGWYGFTLSGLPELRALVPDALRFMVATGRVLPWFDAIGGAMCARDKEKSR